MRDVKKVVLHCSDSALPNQNAAMIRTWHTLPVEKGGRGWKDIGYHYFIGFSGLVEQGRLPDVVGAHCEGHNHDSLGICLAGKAIKTFLPVQFDTLRLILRLLKKAYPHAEVYGHHEFNPQKTCPVFPVAEWKEFWKTLP